MQIPEGHKFAAYFLSQCDVADDVPVEDLELQQLGVRISGRIATEVEPHWPRWLGTLTMDELKNDGLAIYVSAPAREPEVLN